MLRRSVPQRKVPSKPSAFLGGRNTFTFADFLLKLQRQTPAQARQSFYQSQELFEHRPDMLTSAVNQLPWSHGLALLSASYYTMHNVEVDAYRAALANMVRANKRSEQPVVDWRCALMTLSQAVQAYGNQVPNNAYTSAIKLCAPGRHWAAALAVVKAADAHDQTSMKLLLAAAHATATPSHQHAWSAALKLLNLSQVYVAEVAMAATKKLTGPGYLLSEGDTTSGEADGGASSIPDDVVRRLNADLEWYGSGMPPDKETVKKLAELKVVAEVSASVVGALPWQIALQLLDSMSGDSPLHRVLHYHLQATLPTVRPLQPNAKLTPGGRAQLTLPLVSSLPWEKAIELYLNAMQSKAFASTEAIEHGLVALLRKGIPCYGVAQKLIGVAEDSARELASENRDGERDRYHIAASSLNSHELHRGLALAATSELLEEERIASSQRRAVVKAATWKNALRHVMALASGPPLHLSSELSSSATRRHQLALPMDARSALLMSLARRGQHEEVVRVAGSFASRGEKVSVSAVDAMIASAVKVEEHRAVVVPRIEEEDGSTSSRLPMVRWDTAMAWFTQMHPQQQVGDVHVQALPTTSAHGIGEQRHPLAIKMSPSVFSHLFRLTVLQDAPDAGRHLLVLGQQQGIELRHHKELQAALFCAEYDRVGEAIGILRTVLMTGTAVTRQLQESEGRKNDSGLIALKDAVPLVPVVWQLAQRHGRQLEVVDAIRSVIPRFGRP